MMGFECVVRALKSGYFVRRPSWPAEDHLELSLPPLDDVLQIDVPPRVLYVDVQPCFDAIKEYLASSDDILATDWEKYDKRKTT